MTKEQLEAGIQLTEKMDLVGQEYVESGAVGAIHKIAFINSHGTEYTFEAVHQNIMDECLKMCRENMENTMDYLKKQFEDI